MDDKPIAPDLALRLRAACNGHPHAKIPWPHRLLHEAADAIEKMAALPTDAELDSIDNVDGA